MQQEGISQSPQLRTSGPQGWAYLCTGAAWMLSCLNGVEKQLTARASSQALLELKELLLQFQKSQGWGVIRRMLHFLNAQGFRQQFEEQEQELRDCLVQLSTFLSMTHFTSQVGAAASSGKHSQLAQCDLLKPIAMMLRSTDCGAAWQSVDFRKLAKITSERRR
jgi:hypothetical protein